MKHKLSQNILAIITVALLLITMGAAFGVLSGRGPFIGMVSTCILATVTALVGGTKYGVSSTTGPMTAAIAVILAAEHGSLDLYMYTLLFASVFLLILNLLNIHKIVSWIPNLVIAGFVNGIALLILVSQAKSIEGLINWVILGVTFALAMAVHKAKPYAAHPVAEVLLSSFVVIVAVTLGVHIFNIPAEFLSLNVGGLEHITHIYMPKWESSMLWIVVPLAFELALIALLDTLLTGLIMEKESKQQTQFKRELTGQSIAMFLTSWIGGVPGAQSTVPSMMFLKEGAHHRYSKIILALVCIVMTIGLIPLIEYVPVAVFAGIIFKVAFDVADLTSLRNAHHSQLIMLFGTLLSTVFLSLNLAVIGFTFLFIVWNHLMPKRIHIPDLKFGSEMEGLIDEI